MSVSMSVSVSWNSSLNKLLSPFYRCQHLATSSADVASAVDIDDDRRQLTTLGVQLGVQRDGRYGVRQRRADRSASADSCTYGDDVDAAGARLHRLVPGRVAVVHRAVSDQHQDVNGIGSLALREHIASYPAKSRPPCSRAVFTASKASPVNTARVNTGVRDYTMLTSNVTVEYFTGFT